MAHPAIPRSIPEEVAAQRASVHNALPGDEGPDTQGFCDRGKPTGGKADPHSVPI
jgi:hypothetical protein